MENPVDIVEKPEVPAVGWQRLHIMETSEAVTFFQVFGVFVKGRAGPQGAGNGGAVPPAPSAGGQAGSMRSVLQGGAPNEGRQRARCSGEDKGRHRPGAVIGEKSQTGRSVLPKPP